jgi:hypothetical protein
MNSIPNDWQRVMIIVKRLLDLSKYRKSLHSRYRLTADTGFRFALPKFAVGELCMFTKHYMNFQPCQKIKRGSNHV